MRGSARPSGRPDHDDEACALEIARASSTTELLDAWRHPEERFVSQWEERFGADVLAPVLADTVTRALHQARVEPTDLATVIVDATNARAAAGLPRTLGLKPEQVADPLAASVGRAGAAHAGLLLARALDGARPGDRILVASLADGCDAVVFEVTEHIDAARPAHAVDACTGCGQCERACPARLPVRRLLVEAHGVLTQGRAEARV